VQLLQQELLTHPKHLSYPPVFSGVRVAQTLAFCVFCRSLFVLLSSFFRPVCCLSFSDLRLLIIPLVFHTFLGPRPGDWLVMYVCVKWIDLAFISTIFQLDFGSFDNCISYKTCTYIVINLDKMTAVMIKVMSAISAWMWT
jgi:hypothetical protein